MKKQSLFKALLLATSILAFHPSLYAAGDDLIETDKDIFDIGKVGRSKFVKDKIEAHRLSNKGNIDIGEELFVRFYTGGVGLDSFLRAVDCNRDKLIDVLFSYNLNTIDPGCLVNGYTEMKGIFFDFFKNRKIPGQLRDLFKDHDKIAKATDNPFSEMENATFHRNYYEPFVLQVIASEEVTTLPNVFLIKFANGMNRKLRIFANDQLRNDNMWRSNNLWNVLCEGNQFSRLVKAGNVQEIERCKLLETEDLHRLETREIDYMVGALKLDMCERLFKSKGLPQVEIERHNRDIKQLRHVWAKELAQSPLHAKKTAAFYSVLLDMALSEVVSLETAIKQGSQEMVGVRQQELQKVKEKITFFHNALEDIGTHVKLAEVDLCDMLLKLTLYYERLAEQFKRDSVCPALAVDVQLKNKLFAERLKLEATRFAKAFDQLQSGLVQDIDYKLRVKGHAVEKRFEEKQKRNLKLENDTVRYVDDPLRPYDPPRRVAVHQEWKLNDDFQVCNRIVEAEVVRLIDGNKKYFNPIYLSKDPFLPIGLQDINEVYPQDVSDNEWLRTFPQEIYDGVLYLLVPHNERATLLRNIGLFNHVQDSPYWYEDFARTTIGGVSLEGRKIPFVDDASFLQLFGDSASRRDIFDIFKNLHSVFSKANIGADDALRDQKMKARKRFKRLVARYIELEQNSIGGDVQLIEARGKTKAALAFIQNYGRCIDGVCDGLNHLEGEMFRDESYLEAEIGGVFSDNALQFCSKFGQMSGSAEWKTVAPQFVRDRLMFSLPLQGEPRLRFYCLFNSVSDLADSTFSPNNLMRTFLTGGRVAVANFTSVNFEAFTADKAIDLIFDAYKRGQKKAKDGVTLSHKNIVAFIEQDPYLNSFYEEFGDEIFDNEDYENDFFCPKEKGTYKRELFAYILERLGYIIDPKSRWDADAKKKKAEQVEQKEERIRSAKVPLTTSPLMLTGTKDEFEQEKACELLDLNFNFDSLVVDQTERDKVKFTFAKSGTNQIVSGVFNMQDNFGFYFNNSKLVYAQGTHVCQILDPVRKINVDLQKGEGGLVVIKTLGLTHFSVSSRLPIVYSGQLEDMPSLAFKTPLFSNRGTLSSTKLRFDCEKVENLGHIISLNPVQLVRDGTCVFNKGQGLLLVPSLAGDDTVLWDDQLDYDQMDVKVSVDNTGMANRIVLKLKHKLTGLTQKEAFDLEPHEGIEWKDGSIRKIKNGPYLRFANAQNNVNVVLGSNQEKAIVLYGCSGINNFGLKTKEKVVHSGQKLPLKRVNVTCPSFSNVGLMTVDQLVFNGKEIVNSGHILSTQPIQFVQRTTIDNGGLVKSENEEYPQGKQNKDPM